MEVLQKHGDVFSLYRLPSSYGCLVFNAAYPTGADIQLPEQEMVMRILREILICSTYKYKGNSENLRVNHMVAWYSKTVISSQQVQPVSAAPVCRVALSVPITRAYLSHGWNCKHCRNYHYACPGMLTGTPCFSVLGTKSEGRVHKSKITNTTQQGDIAMKSKKPSLYDAQEEQIQLQSASFVDFLTRKGVLEDHNIDNERVRKAKRILHRKHITIPRSC